MANDLDLNISNGAFHFAPSDHDAFVAQLTRLPEEDRDGSIAYSYQDWTFWISPDKTRCRFHMRPSSSETPGEQAGRGQPAAHPNSR